MGRVFDMPWLGGSKYHERGLLIPWIGGLICHGEWGQKYHGMGFDIPWVWGSFGRNEGVQFTMMGFKME
jgi:hypothetical protein